MSSRFSRVDDTIPRSPTSHKFAQSQKGQHSLADSLRDGLPHTLSPTEDYFKILPVHSQQTPTGRVTPPSHVDLPKLSLGAELALVALQYLPTPILVLSDFKSVIVANDAMGLLLGLHRYQPENGKEVDHLDKDVSVGDLLEGQTLSQIGVDMVQDGQPIWVNWEKFFDNLAREADNKSTAAADISELNEDPTEIGGNKPLNSLSAALDGAAAGWSLKKTRALVHDTVVNVAITSRFVGSSRSEKIRRNPTSASQIHAKMVISIWRVDHQRFFTLTFSSSAIAPPTSINKPISRTVSRIPKTSSVSPASSYQSNSPGSSSYSNRNRCFHCGTVVSPTQGSSAAVPFGPNAHNAPTILEKTMRMKDAMLNATDIPLFAMWKDFSLGFPNKAASNLMSRAFDATTDDTYEPLSRFEMYTEDFSRKLQTDELPIVELINTEKPFQGRRVGGVDSKGQKMVWDISGKGLHDESGEFIAGIISIKDVTRYTDEIKYQSEQKEEHFKDICDAMPEMLWRANTDGYPDWWSKRWYDYSGLTPEESLGSNWGNNFHPDDMIKTMERWTHSLATGDEYVTEYRCKRKDGVWRWMLGRALPLRDPKTGKILKWYGACTDINDLVEAQQNVKRYREQLETVIKHARVTMWMVDKERRLTFLEGPSMWKTAERIDNTFQYIGRDVFEVFIETGGAAHIDLYKNRMESILNGETDDQILEHTVLETGRCYRTKFTAAISNADERGHGATIKGVVGTSFDVTELKKRTTELEARDKENNRLLLAETAAKDASRLKSQFLANMSHEIRTPIAGVIGMSELLLDTQLDEEQRDCAENIQRSANGLLTVINDILDLSKVESGRLDIEEVQFSLSIVISDVCKMLSFAAERKNLMFLEDIQLPQVEDLVVLGDPGRCRQILTNLLTNSVKFTSDGYVKLSVKAKEETSETIQILFVVEDTGIGIEEEVRKKLFKPFSQADSSTARRFGGTGLGLTISKNLVDLMHGGIALDSVLGQGTTASFWIPFNKPQYVNDSRTPVADVTMISERLQAELSISGCDSDPERLRNTPPQSPMETFGQAKSKPFHSRPMPKPLQQSTQEKLDATERKEVHVLVVEDNAINQQIALKTIKRLGFSVNAVWNGKEALDYLLEEHNVQRPRPDVILMDVQMPILDGYRATHLIRHHSPYSSLPGIQQTPIVAMTASAIQGDREKCERAGMDDYLAKPVRGHILEAMLVKWALRVKGSDGESTQSFHSLPTEHDSNCADYNHLLPAFKTVGIQATATTAPNIPTDASRRQAQVRALASGSAAETEGERGLRRAAAEEKAVELRNDKLLSAADEEPHSVQGQHQLHAQLSPSAEFAPRFPYGALTEENVGKLGGKAQQVSTDSLLATEQDINDVDDQKYENDEDDYVAIGGIAGKSHGRKTSSSTQLGSPNGSAEQSSNSSGGVTPTTSSERVARAISSRRQNGSPGANHNTSSSEVGAVGRAAGPLLGTTGARSPLASPPLVADAEVDEVGLMKRKAKNGKGWDEPTASTEGKEVKLRPQRMGIERLSSERTVVPDDYR